MNKTELIEKVAEKADMQKNEAAVAVKAVIDVITEAVAGGEDVQLVGFGTFKKNKRAARTGRNPQTGETTKIPAMNIPAFKAGKGFKDACNR